MIIAERRSQKCGLFFKMSKMEKSIKRKVLEKADKLGNSATEKEVAELDEKLPAMKKGVIAKAWDKVLFLWEKIKSPDVPASLKIVIAGALLYLVLPLDVLPDAIPGIGLLDDLSVILTVVREVSKYALPKLEKKLEQKFYEASYQKIDEKLSQVFSSMLLSSLITFLINAAGCCILIFKPFGALPSRYTAIVFFSLAFVYSSVRIIIYLKKYGKVIKKISASIYRKKNFAEGIADFVCTEYKSIEYIFTGIRIAKNIIPELSDIPDAPEIVNVFKDHYKRRIILAILIIVLYSLLIWLTKFLLLL